MLSQKRMFYIFPKCWLGLFKCWKLYFGMAMGLGDTWNSMWGDVPLISYLVWAGYQIKCQVGSLKFNSSSFLWLLLSRTTLGLNPTPFPPTFLIRPVASQQLLLGVTLHDVDIMVASRDKSWLPGCILGQLMTSWVMCYKKGICSQNSIHSKVHFKTSTAVFDVLIICLTFGPLGYRII